MKYKFVSVKIRSGESGNVYEFYPKTKEEEDLRGDLVILVFCGEEIEDREKIFIENKIANFISDKYYSDLEKSPFISLKTSVSEGIRKYSQYPNIEIVSITLVSDVVNIVFYGGAEVKIERNGLIADVFRGSGEVSGISGFVQKNDSFLLGTKSFFENYPTGMIKANLLKKDMKEAAGSFSTIRNGIGGENNYFALMMKVDEGKTKDYFQKTLLKSGDDKRSPEGKENPATFIKPTFPQWAQSLKNKGNIISRTFSRIGKRNLYINTSINENNFSTSRKKMTVNIGAILLILLSVSIFFGIKERKRLVVKQKYVQEIADIKYDLDEAQNLYPVSPERSRQLFSQAREKVLGLKTEGVRTDQIKGLEDKLTENEATILREFRNKPSEFVNLSLISEGFRGDGMSFSNGKIYTFDRQARKVATTAIENKNARIILGPHQIDGFYDIAVYSDRLFLAKNNGVFELNETPDKVIESTWEKEVLIEAYAGNIYLLDKQKSQILRYSGSDRGFSKGVNWLSDDITLDLTNAKSVVIDGMVWVLKEDGKILKLNLGNPQTFKISVPSEGNIAVTSFYTDESLKNIYILDEADKSIYVLNKNGEYLARYINEEIGGANSLIASEEFSKIFFLKEGKIYVIEMSGSIGE